MAKFDLTSRVGQYLDRHLVFPLLEFMSARQVCNLYTNIRKKGDKMLYHILQIYDEKEVLKAKLDILSKTNMIDYAIDIRKQLHADEEIPEVGNKTQFFFQNLICIKLFIKHSSKQN